MICCVGLCAYLRGPFASVEYACAVEGEDRSEVSLCCVLQSISRPQGWQASVGVVFQHHPRTVGAHFRKDGGLGILSTAVKQFEGWRIFCSTVFRVPMYLPLPLFFHFIQSDKFAIYRGVHSTGVTNEEVLSLRPRNLLARCMRSLASRERTVRQHTFPRHQN